MFWLRNKKNNFLVRTLNERPEQQKKEPAHNIPLSLSFQIAPLNCLKTLARYSPVIEVRKKAKIRNRYNQVPRLTQDTNGKVTTHNKTLQTRA